MGVLLLQRSAPRDFSTPFLAMPGELPVDHWPRILDAARCMAGTEWYIRGRGMDLTTPGWSKRTAQLVHYVAPRCRPRLQSELAHWIENQPRFRAFVAVNQDKVRKKLTTSDDEEHRLDVRAELLVAYLIAADPR